MLPVLEAGSCSGAGHFQLQPTPPGPDALSSHTQKHTLWGGGGVDPSEAVVWEKDSVKSADESWRKQRETIGYTES